MASELKPGDVVRLKSGGPKMTVESVDAGSKGPFAQCVWIAGPDARRFSVGCDTLVKAAR